MGYWPHFKAQGALAFIDCFTGLVPCKILSGDYGLPGEYQAELHLTVRVTANRGAYRKGEILRLKGYQVVPRKAVSIRNYKYYIKKHVWEV